MEIQGINPGAGFAGRFALDAESFELLLAAAFVMQQQNDRVRSVAVTEAPPSVPESFGAELSPAALPFASGQEPRENSAALSAADLMHGPGDDLFQILEQIAETQREIQARQLSLQKTLELVCACAMDAAHAQGAAIGLLDEEDLVYRAGCGTGAREIGQRVKAQWSLPAECLLYGDALFCPVVEPSSSVDPELCRKREAQSVVAVPIYSDGSVRGALELTASKPGAFRSHTVRAAELLAGMVTEALARAREAQWRQSLAEERNLMLAALEQLRPQLELLAHAKQNQQEPSGEASVREASQIVEPARTGAIDDFILPGDEPADAETSSVGIASDVVPSLQTGDASTPNAVAAPPLPLPPIFNCSECGVPVESGAQECDMCAAEKDLRSGSASAATSGAGSAEEAPAPAAVDSTEQIAHDGTVLPKSALATIPTSPLARDRSSRANAPLDNWNPSFMQKQDSAGSRLWDEFGWAIALVLVLILLAALATWLWYGLGYAGVQNHGATHNISVQAEVQLTWWEKVLVSLGLAEPPPAPVYLGSPNAQVWEDRKTALYYCSDEPQYGKTTPGKFATQRDAQLDKFEPAQRKPCE